MSKYLYPFLLSARTITAQQTVENDCAPADSQPSFPNPQFIPNTLYQQQPLYQEQLDDNHTLLFNPQGLGTPIVVNQSGKEILSHFQKPQLLVTEPSPFIQQLITHELITPTHPTRSSLPQSKVETLVAWLHITNACNLRCPYCYLHKTKDEMELAHGKLAVDAVIRSAVAHGFKRLKLKYAGGEALLNHKTLFALDQYAREQVTLHQLEFDAVILSNGVSISDRIIGTLKQRGIRLMISLDGVGETHDKLRYLKNGRGTFKRVEQTLDRLAAQNITPSISITVTGENGSQLPETVAYLLERQLPFTINFFRDNACVTDYQTMAYEETQILTAMTEAFALIEQDLPPYSLLGAILDRVRFDAPHHKPCGVGENYLIVDQNGQIAQCHMEIEKTITDIHAEDPLSLLKHQKQDWQNIPVEEKEGCRSCEWRYWCAGGCPALTYRATGRFDIKSPNCNIYKQLFPAVLRLEGLRLLKYATASSPVA